MRVKMKIVIALIFFIFFLTACAPNYVGKSIRNYPVDEVCKIDSIPAKCSVVYPNFNITYDIVKTAKEDEYSINGKATYTGSTTFKNFGSAGFTLFLIRDGEVYKEFFIGGGSGYLENGITFGRKFISYVEPKASILTYNMKVRG
jgi:hypothetical protein